MPGALGVRVAVLAAALVAVAVVCALADWSPATIIIVMAAAFLAASAIEVLASSRERAAPEAEEPEPAVGADLADRVRVLEVEPSEEPVADEVEAVVSEVTPEPESQAEETEPAAEPEAVVAPEPEPEPEPEREPEPEPEPERQPLAAVPPPSPVPEPVATEPVEPPVVVSLAARDARVREWNLWELERLAREHAGDDPVRDEERNYLLMYMRDYATPDGMLPADFDPLVRDSFGDLLAALPR